MIFGKIKKNVKSCFFMDNLFAHNMEYVLRRFLIPMKYIIKISVATDLFDILEKFGHKYRGTR